MRLTARLPLTLRLTALFAAGSCVVLLALGWMIAGAIEQHFEDLDRDALRARLMGAQHVIERVSNADALAHFSEALQDVERGHHGLFLRIEAPDQKLLFATLEAEFPSDWRARASASQAAGLFEWTANGSSFRALAMQVPTTLPQVPVLHVVAALDLAHHTVFMDAFKRSLWMFVAGSAVAMGFLGWLAASRGLAPLRAMRERATLVTARSLDQRLPADAVPLELAELATTLNEMLARLEEAFLRLSDFSSDIAHELRTPISNLMTQTQVSLSRARDAQEYRAILESNAEEYERLARMISDMLFLAQADSPLASERMLTQRVQVDLTREVQDLFDFYEALAEEKGVALQLQGEGTVCGDRLMLRRAISNLLSNAIRYTDTGQEVSVALRTEGGEVVLGVENPGETLSPQQLARLFERFYRTDFARQHVEGEGTGLGLAITKAIVQAHRGRLTARSHNGCNRFEMHLPTA
jgi:two-component system heavy metal sensor histidine kinase CusS